MRTDNSTADGIMNKTVEQNQSKSMDVRFYWLQDRVEQRQFRVFWAPGKINLADFHLKVQPTNGHQAVRTIYLYVVEGKMCDRILESLASGTNSKDTVRPLLAE